MADRLCVIDVDVFGACFACVTAFCTGTQGLRTLDMTGQAGRNMSSPTSLDTPPTPFVRKTTGAMGGSGFMLTRSKDFRNFYYFLAKYVLYVVSVLPLTAP